MTNVDLVNDKCWFCEHIGRSMTYVGKVNIKCKEYLSDLDSVESVNHTKYKVVWCDIHSVREG